MAVQRVSGPIPAAGSPTGSEFEVELPVMEKERRSADRAAIPELSPARARRVLIVDDNRDSVPSLAKLLELAGHTTRTAYDGIEALIAAESFKPEAVLLDIGLPRLNGYETAQRLREQPWGKEMLLVALTGWGQDHDRRRSAAAGFDAHMVKPAEFAELNRLLAEGRPAADGHQ